MFWSPSSTVGPVPDQLDTADQRKWKRARLSSVQLTTYFYGFSELLKLRRAAETQPGFSERAYHDRLLSWGSPAMKYVRQLVAKH